MYCYLTEHCEIKKNGKWIFDESYPVEEREIDYKEFHLIPCYRTRRLFQFLGGKERVYYKCGLLVKLVSTLPDQTKRYIYNFQY